MKPLPGMAAPVQELPVRADAPEKLCLWSDRPAKAWMTEALPIGNDPMGAMLFGGTGVERVQFNEISLWAGTRMAVEGLDDDGQDLGAYQAFGDILIHLGHDFSKVTAYRQELDIDRAVHQVTYESNGVRYQRRAFASHPDGVIVIQLTANKPVAYTMLRSLLNVVRETKTIYGDSGGGVYQNLFDSHPPFQIDGNFGATAGFCEMLVQSHESQGTGDRGQESGVRGRGSVIHLLPALPKAWPTGKVTGLCARGGFAVEMIWKDGHLTKAVIHSKSGLPCKVVCGDKTWELNTTAGKSYPLTLPLP
ncbi:MAG: glycoside hydrolase family 95 protein [Akkermansiaceae bacterium]|nr:glycoside hydrolase family 95 protein [Akkermansiaceae bacterium]